MPDIDSHKSSVEIPSIQSENALLNDSYAAPLLPDGSRAIRYFVEEDANGYMLLPPLAGEKDGGRTLRSPSLKALREGFEALLEEVELNPLDFKHAAYRSEANLIVTSKNLPGTDALAITDITPSGQHRITFNSAKRFSADLLEATTAHAFEISFGYPKRQYDAIPNDPYFKKR